MAEKFTKYFLIVILSTILCKAFFPYPPNQQRPTEIKNSTLASMLESDVNFDHFIFRNGEDKKPLALMLDFPIWENEETEDDDETSGEYHQGEASGPKFIEAKNSQLFPDKDRVVAIPLFILFHSWKNFLF